MLIADASEAWRNQNTMGIGRRESAGKETQVITDNGSLRLSDVPANGGNGLDDKAGGVTVEISDEAMDKLQQEKKTAQKDSSVIDMSYYQEQLEAMKENVEKSEEAFSLLGKLMEIARRIANGDKVPASDEKKLMEYDNDWYQAVKAAAMLNANKKHKKYKSLFEDEDEKSTEDKARALLREDAEAAGGEAAAVTEGGAADAETAR